MTYGLHPQMDCLYLQSAGIVSRSSSIYVWFNSAWAGGMLLHFNSLANSAEI